jgi:hypothetical protein
MDIGPAPDPIGDPRAYQEHLLAWLGDDDPAEVQAGGVEVWRSLIAEAGSAAFGRPGPHEWSAVGCLAHALDAEIVMSARYRWILAHDEPPLVGYDQDLWYDRLHAGEEEEPSRLLAVLSALRDANVALWRRSSEPDRARVGIHAERGPESYDLSFRMIAGHDRLHQAQARRAIDAVRD